MDALTRFVRGVETHTDEGRRRIVKKWVSEMRLNGKEPTWEGCRGFALLAELADLRADDHPGTRGERAERADSWGVAMASELPSDPPTSMI